MDAEQFDALVARLAQGPSRRAALKGLAGGVIASIIIDTASSGAREKRKQGKSRDKRQRDGRHGGRGRLGSGEQHEKRDGNGQGRNANRKNQKQRKRERARTEHHRERERARQDVDAEKKRKKNRCKKNGKPCSGNNTCCSKFCHPQSGKCSRKPVS